MDNGLGHHWFRQRFVAYSPWTNTNLSIGSSVNSQKWTLNQNTKVYMKKTYEMSSMKWHPFCSDLGFVNHCRSSWTVANVYDYYNHDGADQSRRYWCLSVLSQHPQRNCCNIGYYMSVWNSSYAQILRNLVRPWYPFQFLNHFPFLQGVWQYHCRALCQVICKDVFARELSLRWVSEGCHILKHTQALLFKQHRH